MDIKKSLEKRLKDIDPMTKCILPIVKMAKIDNNPYCTNSNNKNHYKQTPKRNYKQRL